MKFMETKKIILTRGIQGSGVITSTYNRYKNFYEEESNNC